MKFGFKSLTALIALTLVAAVHATPPGNNGGGNGGCGVGQQTNGCGTTNAPVANGGAGGKATAGATALAGAAASARQSTRVQVGVNAASRNRNDLTAYGGNGYSQSGGNVLLNEGSRTTVEGSSNTTYYAAQERNPVATAYAAPLTATNGTCMGSTSAGGQGTAFGLTFGTTWTDGKCDARYDAEALRAVAGNSAAIARLCQVKELRQAIEDSGQTCPAKGKVAAATTPSAPIMMPNVSEETARAQYTDPIIRARLGLPPL